MLALALALARPGHTEPTVAVTLTLPSGKTLLVGPSGQLYEPQDRGAWQRTIPGGVAVELKSAALLPDGAGIVAAGEGTPVYRFVENAWHVMPLENRGTTRLARGPVLAVGSQVYHWTASERWQRIAATSSPITALWAGSEIYLATRRGTLARLSGTRQSAIAVPLAPGDPVTLLIGPPAGGPVYGISQSSAVLMVTGRRARLVELTPALAGLAVQAAAVDAQGTLWIAGTVPLAPAEQAQSHAVPGDAGSVDAGPADAGSRTEPTQTVLARTRGKTLELVEPLSWINPDDFVTVLLVEVDDTVFLATRQGLLQIRLPREGWKSATIEDSFPARANSSAPVTPARTR